MFEWCSMAEITTSSPAPTFVLPQVAATRLMASVVPLVQMTSSGSAAWRNGGSGLSVRTPEETLQADSRRLVLVGRPLAELVDAAMDVGTVALVVGDDGVDDLPRRLRGRGVVQVDQPAAVHLLAQGWEVRAQGLGVEAGHGR